MKMEFKAKGGLVVFLILFALIGNVSATVESYRCKDGTPSGDNACGDGSTPMVMCNTDPTGNCPIICAAECGSATGCVGGDCENCCSAGICSKYTYDSDEFDACMKSCEGTCEVNELAKGIFRNIALVGAIAMLILYPIVSTVISTIAGFIAKRTY